MTKRASFVGILLAAVLATTTVGCGVEKDATYSSAAALKAAAVKVGYECPQWSDIDPEEASFDAGACLSDNRDQFRVYAGQSEREQDLEDNILGTQLVMAGSRVDAVLLVGPNWTIRGPAPEVEALKGELGGYLPDLSDVRMPS